MHLKRLSISLLSSELDSEFQLGPKIGTFSQARRFSCMPVTPTPLFTLAEEELFNSDALKRRLSGDLTWIRDEEKNDIYTSMGENLAKITQNLVDNSNILIKTGHKSVDLTKKFMLSGFKCLGMLAFLILTLLVSTCIIFGALCFTYFLFIYCFYFLFIIPLGILGKITDKLGDIQKGRLQ